MHPSGGDCDLAGLVAGQIDALPSGWSGVLNEVDGMLSSDSSGSDKVAGSLSRTLAYMVHNPDYLGWTRSGTGS